MDEDLFREAYRSANPTVCEFEKAILNQSWGCRRSSRVCVADRQGVACTDTGARRLCREFLHRLRQQSRFTLHLSQVPERLSHAQEIRVQLGGLSGARVLYHDADAGKEPLPTVDVVDLLRGLVDRFGSVDAIPLQPLLAEIAALRARRRNRRSPG